MATIVEVPVKRPVKKVERESGLARMGLGLARWSERWFPDPLVFAFAGVVIVFLIGLLLKETPSKLAIQGGKSFWALVPFTMQMVMIIIGGYVVATTPVVHRLIRALAKLPKTGRQAIALIALFSMLTSLISWGLSLIFSGLYVRECAEGQGNGLPGSSRGGLPGVGRRVGAGPVGLGCHDDGHQGRRYHPRCLPSAA